MLEIFTDYFLFYVTVTHQMQPFHLTDNVIKLNNSISLYNFFTYVKIILVLFMGLCFSLLEDFLFSR